MSAPLPSSAERMTMTQQHTPGPWEVAATADDLVLAGRTKIASTYPVGDDVWGAANARLIAAAPTMRTYIAKRAADGCAEALKILEAIDGTA